MHRPERARPTPQKPGLPLSPSRGVLAVSSGLWWWLCTEVSFSLVQWRLGGKRCWESCTGILDIPLPLTTPQNGSRRKRTVQATTCDDLDLSNATSMSTQCLHAWARHAADFTLCKPFRDPVGQILLTTTHSSTFQMRRQKLEEVNGLPWAIL